jgi:Insertion element 4 transposase N-terminal/Transposase DDE domain
MAGDEAVPSASERLTDRIGVGVLTRLLHRDLIDEVIAECGKREKRSRLLPAHVVVYYVLALNLFFGDGYEEVMRHLVGGLRFLRNWRTEWNVPTTSAISQARTRLGAEPMKILFERVAVPMARAGTRGAWYLRWRVMAVDGVVLDVPDTPANAEEFGRTGNDKAASPFPQVRVVGLGECGTHAVVAARLGSVRTDERSLAAGLVAELNDQMLVLADRGFYGYELWHQAAAAGAQLLWRVSSSLQLPVQTVLPDGSYLSILVLPRIRNRARTGRRDLTAEEIAESTPVRVIEYAVDNRNGDGEMFCLITTLLDPNEAPAVELAALYHERWEFEIALDEIEVHQMGHGRVLRSKSPELVKQEIWSLLLTHYAVRDLMREAADTTDYDPDRLSFMRSLRVIRRQVTSQAGFSP